MGADPEAIDNFAIRWACQYGHVQVVRMLLGDKRADPSANNNSAIRWASSEGHVDVVRMLLADKRVDPSAEGNNAIRWARDKGHVQVVQLLLQSKRVHHIALALDNVDWMANHFSSRLELGLLWARDTTLKNGMGAQDRKTVSEYRLAIMQTLRENGDLPEDVSRYMVLDTYVVGFEYD